MTPLAAARRSIAVAAGVVALAAPSAKVTAPFAYVSSVDLSGARIAQFQSGEAGRLIPLDPPVVAMDQGAFTLAVTPNGTSLYAPAGAGVAQFDVDPGTGRLTPKNPATDPGPGSQFGAAVTPDGRSLYVTDTATDTVWQYSIDVASGRLSLKVPGTVAAGGAGAVRYDIAVSPDGRSAYVTNINDGTVSQYDVASATGALTPKQPANVPTGVGPAAVAVGLGGRSMYVYDSGIGAGGSPLTGVSQYDIDPASGTLRPKAPGSVAVPGGHTAAEMAVSPDGRSLYLAQPSAIRKFDVDLATGRLTPKTPAGVPASVSALGIVLASPRQAPSEPTAKDQCKNGGWRAFAQFKNQGQCVSFVASRKPPPPA
jgi:6-phosphogluconolactonase (cycloisomerase 2 family)